MHFGTAVEVVRLLRLTEVVPPLLVVGVGYRTTDLGEIFRLRHRDFTPTIAPSGTPPAWRCRTGPVAFSRSSPTN